MAIAVGCAEGTRAPDGRCTAAWYGHIDPGNGAQNQGSFSYQHSAKDPRDADLKQLQKIKNVLLPKFIKLGVRLSPVESQVLFLIACDLFTQSEVACIGTGGFLEQIQSNSGVLPTVPRIIEWRFKSYHDPKTGLLDAPGFGNNSARVTADQSRRTNAVIDAAEKCGIIKNRRLFHLNSGQ